MTRCFVSLDLPGALRASLAKRQETLKAKDVLHGNWTRPDQLHVTLLFLGEISDDELVRARKALRNVEHEPLAVRAGKTWTFNPSYVRVAWTEVLGVDALQAKIEDALPAHRDERGFHSHATLARAKGFSDRDALLDALKQLSPDEQEHPVGGFSLKQSELTPDGPVHTTIERYEL